MAPKRRPPKPTRCVVHLKRERALQSFEGGRALWCNVTYSGGIFDVLARLNPGDYPEFESEECWFEADR